MYSYAQDVQERINNMINRQLNPLAPKEQELKALDFQKEQILKEQVELFVNQINKERDDRRDILYVIKVFEYDTVRHDFCFSMSYILNSIEYNAMRLTHYFKIGENAVVLNAINIHVVSMFKSFSIKTIEKEDIALLINYLTPSYNGKIVVRYDPQGMIFCKKEENIKKTYYPYARSMPSVAQIYISLPTEFPEYINPDYIPPHLREEKENQENSTTMD